MPELPNSVIDHFRRFRDRFCQKRHKWEIEKGLCLAMLESLDADLTKEGYIESMKRKALDHLALNMIDFIEKRFRFLMREEFEAIHGRDFPPRQKVELFKKHIDFYNACYAGSLDEIETFSENHPLHPVSRETFKHARTGLAHFGTLALAYLDMMVPEFSGRGKGA
ncbi:hypothetical protein [Hydrogenimonas sp.]